ncbi:phospholipase A2 [Rhodococcus sp. NPDC058521]|uniref:phospholipase A2 n=1 Tax=Rhodococcus sp. NPDC058521 TaxID=3346536 RepID=UPI0036521D01
MRITGSRTAVLAVVLAATATITTTGMAGATTSVHENVAAAHTVHSLSPSTVELGEVPADFDSVMGYRPTVLDGRLVNPSGDCSSPVPLPAEFENACKAHDLGYDLLRYATANNEELGPWARKDLDAQLADDMHGACESREVGMDRTSCHVMADVASVAVTGNSWRQGFVTPTKESPLPYALCALGIVLMAGTAIVIRRNNGVRS